MPRPNHPPQFPPQTTYIGCCGRCFSYPQGFSSFVPQVLAVAAVLLTWMAFSSVSLLSPSWLYHAPNFMCLQIERTTRRHLQSGFDDTSTPSSSTFDLYTTECFGLELYSLGYWNDADSDYWAWPIVLASLLGIAAICIGGVATIILLSATCFELDPRRLSSVAISLFVSAGLSLLTLIAGAVSVCKKNNYSNCSRNGARLADGGSLMVFASFFYIAAGIWVHSYRNEVLATETEQEEEQAKKNRDEAVPLVASHLLVSGSGGTHRSYEDDEFTPPSSPLSSSKKKGSRKHHHHHPQSPPHSSSSRNHRHPKVPELDGDEEDQK